MAEPRRRSGSDLARVRVTIPMTAPYRFRGTAKPLGKVSRGWVSHEYIRPIAEVMAVWRPTNQVGYEARDRGDDGGDLAKVARPRT